MAFGNNILQQDIISVQPLSCFICRIVSEPSDSFAKTGELKVDITPNSSVNTITTAIASWSLRAAYIAWHTPPKIKYSGKVTLKGRITMKNATLNNVNIMGGVPLYGTVPSFPSPLIATVPVTISNATGTANIEQPVDAEIEMETEQGLLNIELTSQMGAQLPWCVNPENAEIGDEVDEYDSFISEGDMALCLAFGNSIKNLYVVDILR